MNLRSIFYCALFTGTTLLGITSCNKKTDDPCQDLITAVKKCSGGEAITAGIQKSCNDGFKAVHQEDKSKASDYHQAIIECAHKEKCEEISTCMTQKEMEIIQKAATKKSK